MMHLLVLGATLAIILFGVAWAFSYRLGNYGFLDVVWSFSIGVLAVIYAVLGSGATRHKWLFALVGVVWSWRLGFYILMRVYREHPKEDKRYRTLRQRWPGPAAFLAFFELQALIATLFSLPFLLAAQDPRSTFGHWELLGLGVALCATLGEAIADFQAQRFKRNPRNHDAVLNVGLWRYSRHPNYFFESLVWWGFFLASLDSAYGWITVVCPVLMLYFLLRVTGIPLSERHSLESRGAAYREYQRTTSPFIPWFPSRQATQRRQG